MNTTTPTAETFIEVAIPAIKTPSHDITWLYTRYRNFVLRVCTRYVQNPDEAEDLTQEVFLKADGALLSFSGQSLPSTWLYRIAVNHCLDNLRRNKRQCEIAAYYAIDLENPEGEEETTTPSPMSRVLDLLREELDAMDTHILYLRFDLGLTHDAIGEIRGLSRVAITKRLARIEARALALHTELTHSAAPRLAA